jgi:hypothetical protein
MAPNMSIEQVDRLIEASFHSLHGWMTAEKAKRVARLVVEAGPTPRCVELGVFGGRGVVAMGLTIKYGLTGGTVTGIDPYTAGAALEGVNAKENAEWWSKVDYPAILKSARDGVMKLGLDSIVEFVLQRSQDVVAQYANGSLDLLHQDSNHSEETTTQEVATWTSKMKPGGFWVFDDTNWATTKLAQTHLVAKGFVLREQYDTWAVYQAPR